MTPLFPARSAVCLQWALGVLLVLGCAAAGAPRRVDEGADAWKVRRLTVVGVRSLPRGAVKRLLRLNPRPFAKRPRYSARALRGDSLLIVQVYRSKGFLRASVACSPVVFDSSRHAVGITFRVTEGPRTRIGRISMHDPGSVAPAPKPGTTKLDIGDPLETGRMETDLQRIETWLADHAYLAARAHYDIALSADSLSAGVTYAWDPGPPIVIDTILIDVPGGVRPRVVKRELRFRQGRRCTRAQLRTSTQGLYATNLFSFAAINYDSVARGGTPNDSFRVAQVRVLARPFLTTEVGVGYQTYEQARGSISVTHANVFGLGIRAGALGRASLIGQRIEAGLTVPWLLGAPVDLDTRGSVDRKDEMRILLRSATEGVATRLVVRWSEQTRTSLVHTFQSVDIKEAPAGDSARGRSTTHSLGLELMADGRDDLFDPTRGVFASQVFTVAGLSGAAGSQFIKWDSDVRAFLPLPADMVFSLALRTGLAVPYGRSPGIPAQERYFLGGASVLRGFDEKLAGPLIGGAPTGGTMYLGVNLAELRFPIFRWFSGAVFLDAGNLWDVESRSLADYGSTLSGFALRWNAGFGLSLHLPMVIVRTDVGFKLDKKASESLAAWHLSVGQSF